MGRNALIFFAGILCGCGANSGVNKDSLSPIGESPTGTYLEGLGDGYAALDETCENTDSETYLDRFVTPMFRDSATIDDVVYLVDGSLLWAVSIREPEAPLRLSLTRLPGQSLSVEVGPTGHLVVAAGEAGLLLIDVDNPEAPFVDVQLTLPGAALDVVLVGTHAYVTMGSEGLAVVDVTEPELVSHVSVPGFANAVDGQDNKVYVAACTTMSIFDVTLPVPELLGTYWIPEGHGKELDVVGTEVFVAGGEALFAFDVTDPKRVMWSGYYADPGAPGFYVNAVVVRDGVAYIAAGDESVRAVDVSDLNGAKTYLPQIDDEEAPDLDDPNDLPDAAMGTMSILMGDPINVGLADDHLLVLGNFRWVGERMLRIVEIAKPGVMVDVGIYEQPNTTLGLDPMDDMVVVHEEDGLESIISTEGDLLETFGLPAAVKRADEGSGQMNMLLEDGRIFSFATNELKPRFLVDGAYDMTIGEGYGYYSSPRADQIVRFSLDNGDLFFGPPAQVGFPGYSHLLYFDDTVYAYDWAMGLLYAFDASSLDLLGLADVGQCEMYDIADFYSGQKSIRAQFTPAGDELAMLCPIDEHDESSVLFFDLSDPSQPLVIEELELPDSRYVDVTVDDGVVYALGFDNNSYQSLLVRFEGNDVLEVEFDGHANSFLLHDGMVFVADGDFGLRRFMETVDGFEELTQSNQ